MKNISLLIKPASGRCNMRCRYCFYEDEKENREIVNYEMMTAATAENMIAKAMSEAEESVSFAFQGGEPTVAGLNFFRDFLRLEEKYCRPGLTVSNSIQTNGTLIDREWAEFFRDNRFLVGISIDGTRDLHNLCRVYPGGKSSYADVIRSLRLLQNCGVDANILCVVTAQIAKKGQSVYQELKKTGCRYLQFIPCLDPLEVPRGTMPWSLTPELYSRFLKTTFDFWYRDWERGDYVSVRLFDDYVHLLCGQPAGTCATCGKCGQYYTVEGDGSVFPCDFFVLDGWKMGNVNRMSFAEMEISGTGSRFRTEGSGAPPACEGCKWLSLCNGGCRRDWVDNDTRNYFCSALKDFFEYAMPRLLNIAKQECMLAGG